MRNIYFQLFLFSAICLGACKSATKLYDKGNYDDAVMVAAKKLQSDPGDAKLQSVIRDAYRYAVTGHENNIQSYSQINDDSKWEKIYYEYAALQNLYNAIFRTPSAFELVHPTDYSSDVNTYASKSADVHYNRGIQMMSNNDRQSAKNAYREFQSALSFEPGDATIRQMRDKAYDAAVVRVVILPINDFGFSYSSYNYQLNNFEDEITRKLQSNVGNEFVQFYSPLQAQRTNIMPDETVEMHFSRMNIAGIKDNTSSHEVSRDVVVKEIVYKPDSVVRQYAKVKARLTTTNRTMFSEAGLDFAIRRANGQVIFADNVTSSSGWSTQFTTYTGDERALNDEDRKMTNRSRETPPREDEIISCLRESLFNDFVTKLRNYYSHY